ncbi:rod shape-determining protein RodA [Parapedobacter indicus]|uniref:Cell wall polymerase n=1 Tax=Parapedobacter indicus TaxID=1477437 RepID=A0A1I3IDB3_9SPHI|nr:rod shape-determining protein RodA [Parapedobacter indicus]PPL02117.1 rod shape determining protein RodA [Parapedobacter indicus]SFI45926.1 rod shape determining protein RodA [Parapedobacter indicus]
MTNHPRHRLFGGDVDWFTVLLWFSLCIIGWFNIHAAVFDPEYPSLFNLNTNYGKQSIYIFSAMILAITILIVDAKFYSSISPILYAITILLLITVLIVGRNVGGNQAWIPIGSFRLQPSEFAKLATCLLLARYLSAQSTKSPNLKNLFLGAIIIFLPVILVLMQPDTGSALAFFALVFVFYREGYISGAWMLFGALAILLFVLALAFNPWIVVLTLAAICGLAIYYFRKKIKIIINVVILFALSTIYVFSVEFAYKNVLQSHQRNRIDVILGKIDDPRGEGYNLNQSMIAIGSGQFWGKGYLQGTQTKYNFVPEQSTDFIFCTIGEEWGFVGCMVVIGIYLTLLLRIINIAERQRTAFARIYAYGVACILFFHFAINIGMTIGIVPIIGIPLPFISYGGSSLWSFTILLFIMIKFDSNRKGIV